MTLPVAVVPVLRPVWSADVRQDPSQAGLRLDLLRLHHQPEHHRDQPWYPLHPRSLLVNEDQVLPVVARFYRERIFGPQRKLYLTAPAATTGSDNPGREAGQATLRGKIAELEQAEANLWQQLDAFTPSGDPDLDLQWRTRLQQRFVQVAGEHRTLLGQLQTMTSRPVAPVTNPDLLDRLPTVEFDLLKLPEHHQRRLFDAFGLELRYHRHQHRLALRATLRADTIQALQQALHTLTATSPPREGGTATGADASASAHDPFPMFWVPPYYSPGLRCR